MMLIQSKRNQDTDRPAHESVGCVPDGSQTSKGCGHQNEDRKLHFSGDRNYRISGGKLEIAQKIAAHESSHTTGLYDRRDDDVSLDEVERISI